MCWLAITIHPLWLLHSFLTSYSNMPAVGHMKATLYALHYIHSTHDYGISFMSDSIAPMHSFIHFPPSMDAKAYSDVFPPQYSNSLTLPAYSDVCWGSQIGSLVKLWFRSQMQCLRKLLIFTTSVKVHQSQVIPSLIQILQQFSMMIIIHVRNGRTTWHTRPLVTSNCVKISSRNGSKIRCWRFFMLPARSIPLISLLKKCGIGLTSANLGILSWLVSLTFLMLRFWLSITVVSLHHSL